MAGKILCLLRTYSLSANSVAQFKRVFPRNFEMLSLAVVLCGVAAAQCSIDLNGVGYGAGCGSSGRGGVTTTRTPVDPAAQERYREYLEQKRQIRLQNAAHQSNIRGVEEYKKGNYAKALAAFRAANQSWTSDIYLTNIKLAAQQLGIQIDEKAESNLAPVDAAAASRIADSERKAEATLATGHTDGTPQGNHFFGIAGSPDKPPLADGNLPQAQHIRSALDEASSMANSGRAAVNAQPGPLDPKSADPDVLKAISNCGVDTHFCAEPNHVEYARPVQSAEATDLSQRIPDAAKNNPAIQKRLREYDQFSLHEQGTEKKIAEIDQKIKAGDPNAEVLKVYQADLVNQAAQDKKQKTDTLAAIHDQMQNLGLDWVEQAPKASAKP
jgi:hypothetical protein